MPGVRIHKVIRRVTGELVDSGLPRTRPEIAAIRAAHWATSDRQAALILLMTVQQRLDDADAPRRRPAACARSHSSGVHQGDRARHRLRGAESRRARLRAALPGAGSARSVPAGSARQTAAGRIYLDVGWCGVRPRRRDRRGWQHRWGDAVTSDNLRQNDVVLSGDRVLRIDVIGLRVATDRFMDQVALGLEHREAV